MGHKAGYEGEGDGTINFGFNAGANSTGDYNIELVTNGATTSILNGVSNKINIDSTIIGDTSAKKLAIGNVGVGDVLPDATLEIKPKEITDTALSVQSSGITDVVKVYGANVAVSGRLLGPISPPLLQDSNATINVTLGSGNYHEVELAAAVTKNYI